jgi:hypothetical protein
VVPPAEEPPWGVVGLVLLPPPVASPRVPAAPPPVGPPGEPGEIAPVPVGPPEEPPLDSPVAPPCDPVAPPPDGPLEPPVWASAAVMLTASAAAVRLIAKPRICFLPVLGYRDALLSSTRSKLTTRPAAEQRPAPICLGWRLCTENTEASPECATRGMQRAGGPNKSACLALTSHTGSDQREPARQ